MFYMFVREWLGLSQYGYIVYVMRRSLASNYYLRHRMHNLSVRQFSRRRMREQGSVGSTWFKM